LPIGSVVGPSQASYPSAPSERTRQLSDARRASFRIALARLMSADATTAVEPGSAAPAWHALDVAECERLLQADAEVGLEAGEAERRLKRHGPNTLPSSPPPPLWRRVLEQFANPMQLLLLGAAGASFAVDQVSTAVLLVILTLVNAVMGLQQAAAAEESVAALSEMIQPTARVVRGGEIAEVPAAELVPGDLVLLEAGDAVAADGRLVRTARLAIEEAALTGESQPSGKSTGSSPADAQPADRDGMAFMSTLVTSGSGAMLVTTTGAATQVGQVARMLDEVEDEPSPLERQTGRLTVTYGAIAAGALVFITVSGLARGLDLDELLMVGSAVAIAAIPAALPTVTTALLSGGSRTLAAEGAVVKDLNSVETLGSTTAICSDKTGTLTMNQMTASVLFAAGRRHEVTGRGYEPTGQINHVAGDAVDLEPALTALALCSDAEIKPAGGLLGDPTEGALVVLAAKGGIDVRGTRVRIPRLAEVPFDSSYKLMATFHRVENERGEEVVRCFVKGAPAAILDRASGLVWEGPEPEPIQTARSDIEAVRDQLADEGLRVLLFARRDFAPDELDLEGDLFDRLGDLEVLGMAGIVDPPRPEAQRAVSIATSAGIRVRMITGDHATTAGAIGDQLGITGSAMTGAELDQLEDSALTGRLDNLGVVGRVAPEHKVRLVQALQERGDLVAMTGDGVNDAPALKAADIGVAMGIAGTEVSKQAARMVITDDNFATIVRAVELGRSIYDNLLKSLRYMQVTVAAFLVLFIGASITGIADGQPLTALQILWLAFAITVLPAIALAWDDPASDLMDQPPRIPGEQLMGWQRFARWSVVGAAIGIPALALGALAEGSFPIDGPSVGNTMVLTAMSIGFLVAALGSRHASRSVFAPGGTSPALLRSVAIPGVLVIAVTELEFLREWFGTVSLDGGQWAACLGVGALALAVQELQKRLGRGV
jgi:Ca2+-transporting ATPase